MIKAILTARWMPYAAIGVVALLTTVFGWGYLKGYGKAEGTYTEAMNVALAEQLERERSISKKDIAAVAKTTTREAGIEQGINNIGNSGADCNSAEWLREYNNAIGIVLANTGGATGTTRAPQDSH